MTFDETDSLPPYQQGYMKGLQEGYAKGKSEKHNTMKPEEKERIEKQAEEFASDKIAEASVVEGYIAGATAEHQRAKQLEEPHQLIAQIKDVCTDYEVPGIEALKILQIINDYENGK